MDSSDDESESLNVKLKQAKSSGDFGKYRQLLERKQQLINKKLNSLSVANTQTQRQPNELDECIKMLTEQQEASARPSSNEHANNDTDKINRLKALIKNYASSVNLEDETSCKDNCSMLRGFKQPSLSNLNDEFKKALTDLENKMYEFEKGVGKKKPSDCSVFKSILNGSNNASSTLTLIKIISTLLDYQKDALQELNFEKLKSQEANKQLDIHRKLIDGLTNEILCVKEQNEKINSVYINHITQQAKLEAELDQVKIILKSLMQPNQLHQDALDSQTIYRPKPSVEQAYKPRSQLGSMASINTINEIKYPLDEALNEVKGDRFVERLNAMLQNEAQFGSASCQNFLSNNNRMQNLSLNNNNNNNNTKPSTTRSASAFQFESSGDNFNCDSFLNNKQLMEKYNTQIQEMSQTAKPKVQDNLDKLKQEQQMLKDQINMLNKQRESAQIELEVLSLNAAASSKANGLNENFYKATLIQSFQNSQCTPNMSPIPAENIFQEVTNKFFVQKIT